jgi:Na+-transporting methylmalonyl-CoA/oxaloacetate decarboxylase beta subunit
MNNFIRMHAMGANTAGHVIAGGILLSVVSKMLGIG